MENQFNNDYEFTPSDIKEMVRDGIRFVGDGITKLTKGEKALEYKQWVRNNKDIERENYNAQKDPEEFEYQEQFKEDFQNSDHIKYKNSLEYKAKQVVENVKNVFKKKDDSRGM